MSLGSMGDCTCSDCKKVRWDWEPICDDCLEKRTDLHANAVKEVLALREEMAKILSVAREVVRWRLDPINDCGQFDVAMDELVKVVELHEEERDE